MSPDALRHRLRDGGPWQRLLPGVYLTATGVPTSAQRDMAALLYAGDGSVITGLAAVAEHQFAGPRKSDVDVLVPASRKRVNCDFVVVHRTRRMPDYSVGQGALRYAFPARAVADAVRELDRISDARTIVASAVHQHYDTLTELFKELGVRHSKGDALLRQVLAEVADGIRSAPEGDLRGLITGSELPWPLYNPRLYLHGKFLACPDAWWEAAAVAVEIDSVQFHLLPADWADTMRRHSRMTAAGILVLHYSPWQLRADPDRVLREIAAALGAGRPADGITTRSAAA